MIGEQTQQSTRYLLHVLAPHGPLSRSISYKKLQRYVTYQKNNYGLINIKYNLGGHDLNMGRSTVGEREIKYCCKIVEIRIMEAIFNMTFHVCSFQN